MSEAEKDMKQEDQKAAKQEPEKQEPEKQAPKPVVSGLRAPDAVGAKGKDVKEGDLVKPVHDNDTTDPLTNTRYLATSWTEAVPSAWLDAQVKAGKITKK